MFNMTAGQYMRATPDLSARTPPTTNIIAHPIRSIRTRRTEGVVVVRIGCAEWPPPPVSTF